MKRLSTTAILLSAMLGLSAQAPTALLKADIKHHMDRGTQLCGLDQITFHSTSTGTLSTSSYQWLVNGATASYDTSFTWTSPRPHDTVWISVRLIVHNGPSSSMSDPWEIEVKPSPAKPVIGTFSQMGQVGLRLATQHDVTEWYIGGYSPSATPAGYGQTLMGPMVSPYQVLVDTFYASCFNVSDTLWFGTTGLDELNKDQQYSLIAHDGVITVELKKKSLLEVYDLSGRMLYASVSTHHEVPVGPGVYVVRCGDLFVRKLRL